MRCGGPIAAVPHGFRSGFRDWAAEDTDHPREVAEAALADKVRNQIEAAYRRTTCSSAGASSWTTGPRIWPTVVETRRPNGSADPPRWQPRRTSSSGAEEPGRAAGS